MTESFVITGHKKIKEQSILELVDPATVNTSLPPIRRYNAERKNRILQSRYFIAYKRLIPDGCGIDSSYFYR